MASFIVDARRIHDPAKACPHGIGTDANVRVHIARARSVCSKKQSRRLCGVCTEGDAPGEVIVGTGCGWRHRSVASTEDWAEHLRAEGFDVVMVDLKSLMGK